MTAEPRCDTCRWWRRSPQGDLPGVRGTCGRAGRYTWLLHSDTALVAAVTVSTAHDFACKAWAPDWRDMLTWPVQAPEAAPGTGQPGEAGDAANDVPDGTAGTSDEGAV